APGVYRAALEFRSFEHDPKVPLEKAEPVGVADVLEVEVVVPGRELKEAKSGPSPYLGETGKIRATLACYDCDPGPCDVQPLGAAGNPSGKGVAVPKANDAKLDPAVPGVKYHLYEIEVRPPKVGKNTYRLSWPRLCPGDATPSQTVTVEALGVVEVKHESVHV